MKIEICSARCRSSTKKYIIRTLPEDQASKLCKFEHNGISMLSISEMRNPNQPDHIWQLVEEKQSPDLVEFYVKDVVPADKDKEGHPGYVLTGKDEAPEYLACDEVQVR